MNEVFSPQILQKLAWSAVVLSAVTVVHYVAVATARVAADNEPKSHGLFWSRQISSLAGLALGVWGAWSAFGSIPVKARLCHSAC